MSTFKNLTVVVAHPVCRSVLVGGRRTSVRMEQPIWEALMDICIQEDLSVNDICTMLDSNRGASSLTAAIRVFVASYWHKHMKAIIENVPNALPAKGDGLLHLAIENCHREKD